MKKGFFASAKPAKPKAEPAAPAPTSPSPPSSRPAGFNTSPVDSSTLHFSFLPPTATPKSQTATSALLVTSRAAALLASTPPVPRTSSIPSTPLWEIRSSPGKGLGIFALRDLPQSTLLWKEQPLVVYDPVRGPIQRDAEGAYRYALEHLRPELRAVVLDLENVFGDPKELVVGTLRTNGYPLVQFEGDGVSYHAVFELFSRLNHSCDPNILPRWDEESFSVEISTSKPVKAGDELFVTYIIPLQKRRERRAELLMKYKFECQCAWCGLDDEASAKKDEERERMAAAFLKQWQS